MIIINLTGGIGNQMFQYAFGHILSKKSGVPLKYHFTDALFCTSRNCSLDCFSISTSKASREEVRKTGFPQSFLGRIMYRIFKRTGISGIVYPRIITMENYLKKAGEIEPGNDYYAEGYWQGTKYLDGFEDKIINIFTFKDTPSNNNVNLLDLIRRTNSVSIHIRRGDYITNQGVRRMFDLCGKDYYKRCIDYIYKHIPSPRFFIFTDDIAWAKDNIHTKTSAHFVENNKAWEDMYLMSKCSHNIISNSTFGWWGAFLNKNKKKIVVAPNRWSAKDDPGITNMIPQQWITIAN